MGNATNCIKRQKLYFDAHNNPQNRPHSEAQETQKKPYLVNVNVQLFSNTRVSMNMQSNQTVLDLKKRISYEQMNNLPVELMILKFQFRAVKDNQLISQISNSKALNFAQMKAEAWQIPGVTGDPNFQDVILGQRGAARMSCQHYASRTVMKGTMKYQIQQQNKLQIYCPQLDSKGNVCNQDWDNSLCFLIAGLDINERNAMNQKLAQNQIKKTCKKCPHCPRIVTNYGISQKRVRCACNGPDFCFTCRQNWKGKNNQICQSDTCIFIRKNIAQAPWTREFTMYRKQNTQNKFPVKVPNLRACPRCNQMIMNEANCKHTPCPCTKDKAYSFCFVCLSLSPQPGKNWACGSGYQYCGNVAPNQRLDVPTKIGPELNR